MFDRLLAQEMDEVNVPDHQLYFLHRSHEQTDSLSTVASLIYTSNPTVLHADPVLLYPYNSNSPSSSPPAPLPIRRASRRLFDPNPVEPSFDSTYHRTLLRHIGAFPRGC